MYCSVSFNWPMFWFGQKPDMHCSIREREWMNEWAWLIIKALGWTGQVTWLVVDPRVYIFNYSTTKMCPIPFVTCCFVSHAQNQSSRLTHLYIVPSLHQYFCSPSCRFHTQCGVYCHLVVCQLVVSNDTLSRSYVCNIFTVGSSSIQTPSPFKNKLLDWIKNGLNWLHWPFNPFYAVIHNDKAKPFLAFILF